MKYVKSRGAWFCSPPQHGRRALVAGDWVPRLEVAKRGGTALNRVFAKVLGEAGQFEGKNVTIEYRLALNLRTA
jgi:hypothetical protein